MPAKIFILVCVSLFLMAAGMQLREETTDWKSFCVASFLGLWGLSCLLL